MLFQAFASSSCLLLSSVLLFQGVSSFSPPPLVGTKQQRTSALFVVDPAKIEFPTKRVVSDADVLNVAAFRNGLTNPKMMVENAKGKRSDVDNTGAALDGLKTGFVFIGVPAFAFDYLQGSDFLHALQFYFATGGTIGAILGVNAYLGRSVYVPTEEESENRIIVDFAEGLFRKQDVGFVAESEDSRFAPCGGVMACVDAQLRNSADSWPGLATVPDFPPHFHIKNMEVHDSMRRLGVGTALLETLEAYVREETDAEMLTLEVEDENIPAVRLYEGAGFEFVKNPTAFTKRKFMVKKL